MVPKDPDLLAEQPETTPEVRADRSTSFWIVAFAFLIVMAFATLPSPLYGIYKVRDDLSSLTITIVYAVFAAGTIAVLLAENRIAGRIGRRGAMLGSVLVMMLAAGILAVWHGLPVLVVGRLLTGVAAGLAAGTAITYLIELRLRAQPGSSIVWPRTVGTSISVGALGVGPLIAGCLAQWARWPLTLPYLVMLGLGVIALIGLWFVPETGTLMKRVPPTDKPKKRSARLPVPAAAGTLAAFSANGLFAGLAGLILAITLGRTSHALAGATLFLVFSCGVLSQVATPKLAAPRVLALGTILMLIGLAFLVVSVRLSTPSLALLLGLRGTHRWRGGRRVQGDDWHRARNSGTRRPFDTHVETTCRALCGALDSGGRRGNCARSRCEHPQHGAWIRHPRCPWCLGVGLGPSRATSDVKCQPESRT